LRGVYDLTEYKVKIDGREGIAKLTGNKLEVSWRTGIIRKKVNRLEIDAESIAEYALKNGIKDTYLKVEGHEVFLPSSLVGEIAKIYAIDYERSKKDLNDLYKVLKDCVNLYIELNDFYIKALDDPVIAALEASKLERLREKLSFYSTPEIVNFYIKEIMNTCNELSRINVNYDIRAKEDIMKIIEKIMNLLNYLDSAVTKEKLAGVQEALDDIKRSIDKLGS
jgi:hypothetical protein